MACDGDLGDIQQLRRTKKNDRQEKMGIEQSYRRKQKKLRKF